MQVVWLRRHDREPFVEPLYERWEEVVASFDAADLSKSQLLNQAVLQRAVGPLHAALRLAEVRAQDLDVEFRKSTAELGHTLATTGITVHAEDRVLVGVEGNRTAVAVQITLQSFEVGGGALTLGHYYMHEVVNHGAGEYSRDGITTNSMESVWAVMKRGIHGVYHHASPKHLARYVDEFTFRLNDGNVKVHTLDRLASLVTATSGIRLTYARLTA